MIESLRKLSKAYGDEFAVNFKDSDSTTTDSVTLREMAGGFAESLINIFARSPNGTRAVFGDSILFQNDPHWRDYLLFYEYFHGDSGRGLGASHQTGWTGLIANIIAEWRD